MEASAVGERWSRSLELVATVGGGLSWWCEEVEA